MEMAVSWVAVVNKTCRIASLSCQFSLDAIEVRVSLFPPSNHFCNSCLPPLQFFKMLLKTWQQNRRQYFIKQPHQHRLYNATIHLLLLLPFSSKPTNLLLLTDCRKTRCFQDTAPVVIAIDTTETLQIFSFASILVIVRWQITCLF